MAGNSNIEWTDVTWSPVTGCTRVSAGCDHCFAFSLHDTRYKANRDAARLTTDVWDISGVPATFTDAQRVRASGAALPLPAQYDMPFSRVQLLPERLEEPLHWRKPRRVFVDSMGDLFHADVPDEYIDRVFAIMALTPQHTYQVLTKRPERMREYLSDPNRWERIEDRARDDYGGVCDVWPVANVWLGTSVEGQAAADERIPHLLATPAAVRFLSCEPLLGPMNLTAWLAPSSTDVYHRERRSDEANAAINHLIRAAGRMMGGEFIDWVIVGGESGAKARPCNIEWIRDIVRQCRAASVPVFVKQLGSRPITGDIEPTGDFRTDPETGRRQFAYRATALRLHSRHGSDPAEWAEDLRVREFPKEGK